MINGNADFHKSKNKELKNLKIIKGDLYLTDYSGLKNLDSLEFIDNSLLINNSSIVSMKNLKKIGKNAEFNSSNLKSLDNLVFIGLSDDFTNIEINNLNKLEKIGGRLFLRNAIIHDMSNLKFVGDCIGNHNSKVYPINILDTVKINSQVNEQKNLNLKKEQINNNTCSITQKNNKEENFIGKFR